MQVTYQVWMTINIKSAANSAAFVMWIPLMIFREMLVMAHK